MRTTLITDGLDRPAFSAAVRSLFWRKLSGSLRIAAVCVIAIAAAGCTQSVNKKTDQAELARIALGQGEFSDRLEAMKFLTDQGLLADIARQADHSAIRARAVARLRDQALLADIALNDPDRGVRRGAVRGLSDQNLLARVVFESDSYDVSRDVLGKMTDQALLAKIVVETPNTSLRGLAMERITAQESIAAVASRSDDAEFRQRALQKLTDQKLLAQVAIGWTEENVDLTVLEKLTDVALLRKVASEAGTFVMRRAADKRLPDYAARQDEKRRKNLAESIRDVRVEVAESRVRKGGVALISRPGNLRGQGSFLTAMPDKVIRPSDPDARFVTVAFAIDPSPAVSFGQCDFFILHADGSRQYSRHITAGGQTMQGFAGCDDNQMTGDVDAKTNVILRFEVPVGAIRSAQLSLVGNTRPIVGYSTK